jgi:protein-disulfide isomerase
MMLPRREVLISATALAVAACQGGAPGASQGDMAIGDPAAKATIIEYASVTCPHCADFHRDVRYVFREFPTPPPQIAVAGFQLARCGGATPEQYMARVGVLFEQQRAMFASGSIEGVRAKLIEIGGQAGLSEEQVLTCIADESGAARVRETVEAAQRQFSITGTPTIILNGKKLEGATALTYEGLSGAIDAALSS